MKQQPNRREIDPNRGAPRFASFLERAALLVILLVALMLLYTSLISTNYIDPAQYSGQHILAKQDNLMVNLAVTAAVISCIAYVAAGLLVHFNLPGLLALPLGLALLVAFLLWKKKRGAR